MRARKRQSCYEQEIVPKLLKVVGNTPKQIDRAALAKDILDALEHYRIWRDLINDLKPTAEKKKNLDEISTTANRLMNLLAEAADLRLPLAKSPIARKVERLTGSFRDLAKTIIQKANAGERPLAYVERVPAVVLLMGTLLPRAFSKHFELEPFDVSTETVGPVRKVGINFVLKVMEIEGITKRTGGLYAAGTVRRFWADRRTKDQLIQKRAIPSSAT